MPKNLPILAPGSQQTTRAKKKKSRYAQKVDSGKQMYGGRGKDSCCAHRMKSALIRDPK